MHEVQSHRNFRAKWYIHEISQLTQGSYDISEALISEINKKDEQTNKYDN